MQATVPHSGLLRTEKTLIGVGWAQPSTFKIVRDRGTERQVQGAAVVQLGKKKAQSWVGLTADPPQQ